MSTTSDRIFQAAAADECMAAADEVKGTTVEREGNAIDEYRPSKSCSAIAQAAQNVSMPLRRQLRFAHGC